MGGTPGSEICLSGANQFVLAFITLHFTILPTQNVRSWLKRKRKLLKNITLSNVFIPQKK